MLQIFHELSTVTVITNSLWCVLGVKQPKGMISWMSQTINALQLGHICPGSVPTYCRNASFSFEKPQSEAAANRGTTGPGMLARPHPRCLDRLSMMWVCRGGALNSHMLFTLQVEGRGLWSEQREPSGGLGGNAGRDRSSRGLVNLTCHNTHSIGVCLQISLWDVHRHTHHRGQNIKAVRQSFPGEGRGSVVCSRAFWQRRLCLCGSDQKDEILWPPYNPQRRNLW